MNKTITSFNEFEQFIYTTYSVPGQQIIGINAMYEAIQNHENCTELLDLICNSSPLQLATGTYPIRGIYEVLYDIIRDTIKIPNGDESELWFAISYGGQVKGAVAGESGIEADVEVGDETISLKNYEKTTFDFGSLPTDEVLFMNDFLELAKLLTDSNINKSKGRQQINDVLDRLDTPEMHTDIHHIIQLTAHSDISILKNISKKLQSFYNIGPGFTNSIIHPFCYVIDQMITHKISSVGWWGMIIKSNKTLFLESSHELVPLLLCRNNRLSPAISNFHQNKLFVLGTQLNTRVTKKKTQG
jgi:hypothetical protein